MELKLEKELVYLPETVFDGQTEQGVELDYVLPDYYPDIFKILGCTLTPCTVSYGVSGTRLGIDGVAYIRILYLSENGGSINCVEQRYTYSKTVELSKQVSSPKVCILPKTDYCNCRAVSGRRIDVRGAVSARIKVSGLVGSEILCGASGLGVQVRNSCVGCSGNVLFADRQYVVREDIETGTGGSIAAVLSLSYSLSPAETKVITDKVVIKSEAKLRALYLVKNTDESFGTEVMEANIPISQIIDLTGVTDEHSVFAELDIMDCELGIKQSDVGESRLFGCDMTVDCRISAMKETSLSPVCDLYSTEYESSFTVTPIRIESSPRMVSAQTTVRSDLKSGDGAIGEVLDCRCDVSGVSVRTDESGKLSVFGQVYLRLIGKNTQGVPIAAEKAESFEASPDIPAVGEGFTFTPTVNVGNVNYSISSDNTAEVRAQLLITGLLSGSRTINVVRDITINEDKPRQSDKEYALKLYFADGGESVWNVAKRYNTSVGAIMTENELEGDTVASPCMLLIPII